MSLLPGAFLVFLIFPFSGPPAVIQQTFPSFTACEFTRKDMLTRINPKGQAIQSDCYLIFPPVASAPAPTQE